MPQVTVYIREEDIDKWRALQRKSEFISNALNGLSSNGRTEAFEASNLGSSPSEPAITPIAEDEEESLLPLEIDPTNKKRAWDPNIEEWVKV